MITNAALYIADPSMMGSRMFDQIPDLQSYESLEDGSTATGVRLKFAWGSVRMNFMPPGNLEQHLDGFAGYAQHVIEDQEVLLYTLARIRHVRLLLGCILEHGESEFSDAVTFLFDFNSNMNGLPFFQDSIFDFTGDPLGGPACEEE